MIIKLTQEDYNTATEYSKNCWAETKGGTWGRGLINNKKDPHKVSRVGKLGEIALCRLLDKEVDTEYRTGGDRGVDVKIGPFKADLKVSVYKPSRRRYKRALIKYKTSRGRIKLMSDIYIGGVVYEDSLEVDIFGWICASELRRLPIEDGIIKLEDGGWKNIVLQENLLHPIEDLIIMSKALDKI